MMVLSQSRFHPLLDTHHVYRETAFDSELPISTPLGASRWGREGGFNIFDTHNSCSSIFHERAEGHWSSVHIKIVVFIALKKTGLLVDDHNCKPRCSNNQKTHPNLCVLLLKFCVNTTNLNMRRDWPPSSLARNIGEMPHVLLQVARARYCSEDHCLVALFFPFFSELQRISQHADCLTDLLLQWRSL